MGELGMQLRTNVAFNEPLLKLLLHLHLKVVSFTTFSVYEYLINSLSVIISVKVWIPASRAGMTG